MDDSRVSQIDTLDQRQADQQSGEAQRNVRTAASSEPEVSERAHMIKEFLTTLSPEGLRQYNAALGADLAIPSTAIRRRELLGIFLEFLHQNHRPPSAAEYRELTRAREKDGLPAVPLTTVERHYGGYAQAVKAAVKLHIEGTGAGAQAGKPAHKDPFYWNEAKCFERVEACRDFLGHWPTPREFHMLGSVNNKLEAIYGWSGMDLPGHKTVKRLFGNYGEMLLATQRAVQARQSSPPARPTVATRRRRTRSKRIKVGSAS